MRAVDDCIRRSQGARPLPHSSTPARRGRKFAVAIEIARQETEDRGVLLRPAMAFSPWRWKPLRIVAVVLPFRSELYLSPPAAEQDA
jgi:hypothetical protein